MAYMNQERKASLAAEVAKVMPKNWKYTMSVRHHSTIVLTIREADVDLIGDNLRAQQFHEQRPTHHDVNEFHLHTEYTNAKTLKIMQAIRAALNVGNHDKSDIQSDYFDVGWYVDIQIGKYNSPFVFRPAKQVKPQGMPAGLTVAEEMTWMKQQIIQLGGKV